MKSNVRPSAEKARVLLFPTAAMKTVLISPAYQLPGAGLIPVFVPAYPTHKTGEQHEQAVATVALPAIRLV